MARSQGQGRALLVGNSDGIGLAMTKRLLAMGWNVIGVSRSDSPLRDEGYEHRVADVGEAAYQGVVTELVSGAPVDLCIYCAGIGEPLDPLERGQDHRRQPQRNGANRGRCDSADGQAREWPFHRPLELGR